MLTNDPFISLILFSYVGSKERQKRKFGEELKGKKVSDEKEERYHCLILGLELMTALRRAAKQLGRIAM